MKNIKILIFICFILFFSCDIQTNILVANNTESALVTVSYNRKHYSLFFENHKNDDFLNTIQLRNSHLKFVSCDTLNTNLSLSFILLKNDTLFIEKSRGNNPKYSSIDSITVIKGNSEKIILLSNNYDENFKRYNNIFIYNIY